MKKTLFSLAITLIALPATAADVDVANPWIRGTVPGQKATGAFMELNSKSGATLIGASSPAAGVVEVHEMAMEGGVMKMRALPRLDLPAGKVVALKPGGYHVMLMDLKKPLSKGDVVPVSLKIQGKDGKTEAVDLKVEVRDLTTPATGGHESHRH